ncbi:hypothetical protein BC938DRAFT_481267 [Jimgerdemannia flammicorona]|uniref:Uncharacterized protein n=1 Tax=Jimgerdemannia flammicorona TaxID=994334 RepID=A0A433QGG1_9FUNG|nr:hypothetical protein BC938DRAFT_481267 [Jimgerdemannia flammicorona]
MKTHPTMRIILEEALDGFRAYGFLDHTEMSPCYRAKFSELPKGIAQNIAQLYTAIELASIASQKVGKRKRGDSDTSDAELDVAYGIVTTANTWHFVR